MQILKLLMLMDQHGLLDIYRDGEKVVTIWHPAANGKVFYVFAEAIKALKPQLLPRLKNLPAALRETVGSCLLE